MAKSDKGRPEVKIDYLDLATGISTTAGTEREPGFSELSYPGGAGVVDEPTFIVGGVIKFATYSASGLASWRWALERYTTGDPAPLLDDADASMRQWRDKDRLASGLYMSNPTVAVPGILKVPLRKVYLSIDDRLAFITLPLDSDTDVVEVGEIKVLYKEM